MTIHAGSCPKCGGETAGQYGLAGGGTGAYRFCLGDKDPNCDWMEKKQDTEGMNDPGRPKMYVDGGKHPDEGGLWPHCDPRILHLPDECTYCADQHTLQTERSFFLISNTGHMNRDYKCPADEAREPAKYNAWRGNLPTEVKGLLHVHTLLPPPTQRQREQQALSFTYGNLALSTNHRPSRKAFRDLIKNKYQWSDEDIETWLNAHTWEVE